MIYLKVVIKTAIYDCIKTISKYINVFTSFENVCLKYATKCFKYVKLNNGANWKQMPYIWVYKVCFSLIQFNLIKHNSVIEPCNSILKKG